MKQPPLVFIHRHATWYTGRNAEVMGCAPRCGQYQMPRTSHVQHTHPPEGLTFLIYLLPLAWQSSGNSKQDSGSHSAAVHQEPLRALQLMESGQFFLLWPYLLGKCSLVTG